MGIRILKISKSILLLLGYLFYKNRKSKILFYHDVHRKGFKYTNMSTSIELFKAHVNRIKKDGFVIVDSIDEKYNQVQICFDDGFRGIYDNRIFFIEQGFFPTIFLAISLIGKEGYLGRDEILELQELGFIFECHAYSHENLTKFTNEELKRELYESKLYLEQLLEKDVQEICFPIGFFSQRVYDLCFNYGYNKLHSSIPGNYFDGDMLGLINRNLVQFSSVYDVHFILFGGLIPFRAHYRKRQLINNDI